MQSPRLAHRPASARSKGAGRTRSSSSASPSPPGSCWRKSSTGGAVATRTTDAHPRGLAGLAKRVAEHASSLVRLELELAALEVKRKVTALAVGIGLTIGAAIVAVFALGFLFATAAA